MKAFSLIAMAFFLTLVACGSQGDLDAKVYDQNNGSTEIPALPVEKSLKDCENPVASHAPFSSCGVYDSSNQTICFCYRPSQSVTELFFKSDDDLNHWRSVYPNTVIIYNGASPYDNTGVYVRSVKTQN